MLRTLLNRTRPRSVYDVMAAIACFGVLAGGTAYAANTIGSTDIIDGQVKSVDIGDGEVNSADVKDQSLTTFDVSTFLGADIVDGSLTGADIQDGSIGPVEIAAGSLTTNQVASDTFLGTDLRAETLTSREIRNGNLNDEDIGQVAVADFVGAIGVVPASSCVYRAVTGVTGAGGDHLLLTANTSDAAGGLIYSAEYQPGGTNDVRLKVCNPFAASIDDGNTHFNLLTIDAQ
jgi:hypothetical protein